MKFSDRRIGPLCIGGPTVGRSRAEAAMKFLAGIHLKNNKVPLKLHPDKGILHQWQIALSGM